MEFKEDYAEMRKYVDSDEEVYFCWYLEELKKHGFIIEYTRPETIILSESTKRDVVKHLKTKAVEVEEHVMHGANYTPDFLVKWNTKAIEVFVTIYSTRVKKETPFFCNMNLESTFEIKGEFDRNNMTRLAKTNIKWAFEKYSLLVELLKVPEIFKKTFTPKRYMYTNKDMSLRKIKWNTKTLKTFVNEI